MTLGSTFLLLGLIFPKSMNKVISTLKFSQQKIIQSCHFETLAGSPDSLVTEILSWTGNNIVFTKCICQTIADANYFIPSGMEAALVEKLVQERVIENWQSRSIARPLNQIEEYFSNQNQSFSQNLLLLYLKIWEQGSVILNHNQETEQLMTLGLIVEQDSYFEVSNRLYQSIFDYDWVQEKLFALKIINGTPSKPIPKTPSKRIFLLPNGIIFRNTAITAIIAFVSVLGLGLIFSLVFLFNNSQPEFPSDDKIENTESFSK